MLIVEGILLIPELCSLHSHVKPVVSMLRKAFPWCEVRFLQESVASMDVADKMVFTRAADVISY